jgi:cyclophilin family peptidyl-prolyl cis-trans isomerase
MIDNNFLDWFNSGTESAHPVFGKIVENYALVQQISQVASRNDNPVTPIKMLSVRVQ